MHAAGKVETERHGLATGVLEPLRRGRSPVQGNHVAARGLRVELGGCDVPPAQLLLVRADPDQSRVAHQLGTLYRDAAGCQRCRHSVQHLLAERVGLVGALDLQRRVGLKQVGRRVDAAKDEDEQNEEIAPHGVGVGRSARGFRQPEQTFSHETTRISHR